MEAAGDSNGAGPSPEQDRAPAELTNAALLWFAGASAVVTANGYYIHPIIASVAADFGVSAALVGLVPAMNQIALAVGIFLLLPLGDRVSNKVLARVFMGCQTVMLATMALAQDFYILVAASAMLGFFTITPYLLPAYVSKRVTPGRLGYANAMLTTGIIIGILLARAGSGAVGEYFGWRAVFWIAAAVMLVTTVLVPRLMAPEAVSTKDAARPSYPALLGSIFPIIRERPDILLSGMIQFLSFGVFLSIWMGLGLHLTSAEMGYGTDVVGYLAGLTILNLIVTPRLGRWADGVGALKARRIMATVQLGGVALFLVAGHSLWLLIVPLVISNLSSPVIDIANRMTFLNAQSQIRTRLMTVYIVFMFAGGGLASWAGTAAYDWAGWTGNAVLALAMSAGALTLAAFAERRGPAIKRA